jgi:signal-transduction protein with cAMP-binding, CBS, and nucleotidyltransferase domain
MMHEGRYRHVPVVEDGRPLGMVSSRDALAPELHQLREHLEQHAVDRE